MFSRYLDVEPLVWLELEICDWQCLKTLLPNLADSAGVLDAGNLDAILARHSLLEKWALFGRKFLDRPS